MQPARVLLICSIVLCSACAATVPPTPAPVVVVTAQHCARSEAPALPQMRGTLTMDAPEQLAAMVNRDTLMRRYIAGLRDALDCYDRQAKGDASD